MGAYMAEEHELRKARDVFRRQQQQQQVHKQRETAEFFAEVDAEMERTAERVRQGRRDRGDDGKEQQQQVQLILPPSQRNLFSR